MSDGIVFQVETARVLQILAREIYDSPLALLRENVQNAYDAVRMRFAQDGNLHEGGRIDITITNQELSITDNGIGMDEDVLRRNFWKAGASGKHSNEARRAGVVGTFGIGAMANFGVCRRLTVETSIDQSTEYLRSIAERDSLRIGEDCIALERIPRQRGSGTRITAVLDGQNAISPEQAQQYLLPYVAFLPVPVYLNGTLISCSTVESRLPLAGRRFELLGSKPLSDNTCSADFGVKVDQNGQVMIAVSNIRLCGSTVDGSMTLVQGGGQLFGSRFCFGLAPIPAVGSYQLGGVANLSFLQPTAGREAIGRESIDHVSRLLALAERAASELISESACADTNNAFLQWMLTNGRLDLCGRIAIRVLPDESDVPLSSLGARIAGRTVHYYAGTDPQILRTFADQGLCLLHVAQANPRRKVQTHYITSVLQVPQVPDAAQVTRQYESTELTVPEASVLLRTGSILRDDYLIPDVDVTLADVSHGVSVLAEKGENQVRVRIARSSALLPPLLAFYETAYELFAQFMKDFVRVHIYPRIQEFVPSSTRDGVDALRKHLERNRELYRYEDTELGDIEGVLGDFLAGNASFAEVLRATPSIGRVQSQTVSSDQVGSIETVVPDVVRSPIVPDPVEGGEYAAAPPVVRAEVETDMKILLAEERHSQLNNFTMLLGLSDRLMRTEAEFFRDPHTTRILWGAHRVIYIFTQATGRLNLYYDIELRQPIEGTNASGGMFPTTTLITKKRIFVPVPDPIVSAFKIVDGAREFFVRFDVL